MQHDRHSKAKTLSSQPNVPHSSASGATEMTQPYLPEDPVQLIDRLKNELRRLSAGSGSTEKEEEVARVISTLLKQAHTITWRGVAQGDLDLPSRFFHLLQKLQRFVDLNIPKLPSKSGAAVEIRSVITAFLIAHESLAEVRTRTRLADRERSGTEREILRVFASSPESYLRRGQVWERLTHKPSRARVGQVLIQLCSEGLLKRIQASAQGNPETAYYGLSPSGHDLVKTLDLSPTQEGASLGNQLDRSHYLKILLATALEPLVSSEVRRMAHGLLVSSNASVPEELRAELSTWIHERLTDSTARKLANETRLSLQRIKDSPSYDRQDANVTLLECFDIALSLPQEETSRTEQRPASNPSARHGQFKRDRI